jgi:hypothetical protein
VRPGLPLPEVTIAAKPAHPENAVKAIGGLLAKFGPGAAQPVPTQVDGGTLNKVDLGSFAIYYGVADGKLVVTDSANALAELKGSIGRLSGDGVFKAAKDAAGLGDGGQGFLFVDLKDALPAIDGFAQLANKSIPARTRQQLDGFGQQLGVDLPSLVDALNGPVIAYVRPGLPLPEITVAAKPAHPENAVKAIGGLLARLGSGLARPVPTQVDGGTLNKLDLGSFAVYYGVADGKLVVTDSANALAELKGSVGRLTGDGVFKEAKDAAGMGDDDQGFLFVDLKDALPAIDGFAQLANQNLPPNVEQNLRPLRSLLVFGSRAGDLQSLVAYLKTS